jgi:hypothetical protein
MPPLIEKNQTMTLFVRRYLLGSGGQMVFFFSFISFSFSKGKRGENPTKNLFEERKEEEAENTSKRFAGSGGTLWV